MTQEDKELLLKDLCARLPYGVKCQVEHKDEEGWKTEILSLSGISDDELYFDVGVYANIRNVKPYLYSMSSMTEEESNKYIHLTFEERIDWLNSHHFDYRGLIEKCLAFEELKGIISYGK